VITNYHIAVIDPSNVADANITDYILFFSHNLECIKGMTAGNYWLKLDAIDFCKRELRRWNDELFRRNGPYTARVLRTASRP
jgi:hypothetical protein